ncbi:hypothetical protein LguiB_029917 [Lonicera macranthoides]
MKAAPKLILLFKDAEGFGTAISDALQQNPSSTTFQRLEDSFELPLDRYGIKDCKVSGTFIHFVDANGLHQVSILLLQKYEPPILACAVNEVLASLARENSSNMPTLIIPYFVAASKLKLESKNSTTNDEVSLFGMQIGPETDVTQALVSRAQKLPSSLQIHDEPLACILQLVRVLKMPAFVLTGQSVQSLPHKTFGEEVKVICEIGELLASISSLYFSRDRITWAPTKTSKEHKEPWRALYG